MFFWLVVDHLLVQVQLILPSTYLRVLCVFDYVYHIGSFVWLTLYFFSFSEKLKRIATGCNFWSRKVLHGCMLMTSVSCTNLFVHCCIFLLSLYILYRSFKLSNLVELLLTEKFQRHCCQSNILLLKII